MYVDGLVEQDDNDPEVYKLTPDGVALCIALYTRSMAGESIESLEEEYGLHTGPEGTEDHHLDFKIFMAFGNLTGLFDHFDEMMEMAEALDEVETQYLYGDNNEH